MSSILLADRDVQRVSLTTLQQLNDEGSFLQAFEQLQNQTLPLDWHSPDARLELARLLGHLGAQRRAYALGYRVWHSHRHHHAGAHTRMLRSILARRGAYAAWRFMQKAEPVSATPKEWAEWHALRSAIYATLRDFEQSETAFELALSTDAEQSWIWIERAHALEEADRYDEALTAARHALAISPHSRAAAQSVAHLCVLVGQDEEALHLLRQHAARAQSGSLTAQFIELLLEHQHIDEASQQLDRYEAFVPLADPEMTSWVAARRCDVACIRGDKTDAGRHAAEAGSAFYQRISQRLSDDEVSTKRVILPVGFVRQHHMTCAPATLAAISAFWGKPSDHVGIAEEICYDGTSHYNERQWAERHGWIAREFTVDWVTATALIDRGIPFTLTTTYTEAAHLQAVIGYDDLRGTLLIRDPYRRAHEEIAAAPFLEAQASTGPRGMVLVPDAHADRLNGLTLPDVDIWDRYYALQGALESHHRTEAVQAAQIHEENHPTHRLCISARRTLAGYDGDEPRILAETTALLERYPDDTNLKLSRARSLAMVGTREAQLDWLREIGSERHTDPVCKIRYARLLTEDSRTANQARQLLVAALRQAPANALAWYALAGLEWDVQRRPLATEMYRTAASLHLTNEDYAISYFRAERHLRRTERGLAFLRKRVERLGASSPQPIMTLFDRLEELERTPEGLALLEAEVAHRPDDGALLLFTAKVYQRFARYERADALLTQAAETNCRRTEWLRAKAEQLRMQGEPAAALPLIREAVEQEPFNISLQRTAAFFLSQLEGQASAIAYLQELSARFSHHRGISELLVDWLKQEPYPVTEEALRRLLELNPTYGWALRELTINLTRQGKVAEAREQARISLDIDPGNSYSHSTHAFVLRAAGEHSAALEAAKEAIRLSVDNDYAINLLVQAASNQEERLQAVHFVRDALAHQATFGDGLLTLQSVAKDCIEANELLLTLKEARDTRTDLWHAWLALALQHEVVGQPDQAHTVLDDAIKQFPMLPRLWLEKARIFIQQGMREAGRDCLREALNLSPMWTSAVRLYVESILDEGENFDDARHLLERTLARVPGEAELRAFLALIQWRTDQKVEALDTLQRVIRDDPDYPWAWYRLRDWGVEQGLPDLALQLVRELTERRPGDATAWSIRSELEIDSDMQLEMIGQACVLAPLSISHWDRRLSLLTSAKRFEEARQTLRSTPWGDHPPADIALHEPKLLQAEGRHQEALDALNQLLAQHGNYYEGWRLLADWHDEAGRHSDYLEAAQEMVRLKPAAPLSHGFLGHARKLNNQRTSAKDSFRRALQLESDYEFAAVNLFDLCLDDGEADEARQVLQAIEPHVPADKLLIRRLRICLFANDQAAMKAHLQTIVRNDELHSWYTTEALRLMREALRHDVLNPILDEAVRQGWANYPAVQDWVEQEWGSLRSGYRAIRTLLAKDERHYLKRALLDRIGGTTVPRWLKRFIKEYAAPLREDTTNWGLVGYALLGSNLYRDTVRWLHDWETRHDAPAWALDNLALALRELGKHAEAASVSRLSLARNPENMDAMVWLAIDAAKADQRDELDRWLSQIDPTQLRFYYGCLLRLSRGYAAAASADDARLAIPDFAEAKRLCGEHKHPIYRSLRRKLLIRTLMRHARRIETWTCWVRLPLA